MAAAVLWAAVNELLIQPVEYTCFNLALEKIKGDPRATVRLGTPISAYGQESRNRTARQRIPHRAYQDAAGLEHHQVVLRLQPPSCSSSIFNTGGFEVAFVPTHGCCLREQEFSVFGHGQRASVQIKCRRWIVVETSNPRSDSNNRPRYA